MKSQRSILRSGLVLLFLLMCLAPMVRAWERESNSVFAERRVKLIAAVGAPIVIFGYTGQEEANPSYVFMQEENFYYLTGHNEEGAALLLLPESAAQKGWTGPREILYLPPRDLAQEKWNGPRLGPDDPGIKEKTGFANVEVFTKLHETLANLSRVLPELYTELPGPHDEGYPHAANWANWIKGAASHVTLKDVSSAVATLRAIKSPGELALLTKAIEASIDAQFAAMKMMHSGLYEYQVAAKMVEIHAEGGCETEAYAPIVGSGINSTVLHYNKLDRKIDGSEIALLDVAGQYSGYAADITRTIPADGKFTPRQREIYEIVLGAQNAALAALRPGMDFCNKSGKSVQKIAYNYIDSHGKDLHGKSLGPYFIHGLGHHIGLNVHDAGEHCARFQPGMVITVEPGIYIPEENLGVRIEDDVLITESGHKLLSERLPRDPDEIEKIMAKAELARTQGEKDEARGKNSPAESSADSSVIHSLIEKYAKSVDGADTALAAEVWLDSPDVSFIHPLGHEHGFEQIKQNVYMHLMGDTFSERKLSVHDVSVHEYGDAAWAEFYWDFAAKFRKEGSPLTTHGRETQLYRKEHGRWRLVHVHYSGMPATGERQGF